jgi:hypothetical protein
MEGDMKQPQLTQETKRVVENKLRMLEKSMDRKIALAQKQSEEQRKRA